MAADKPVFDSQQTTAIVYDGENWKYSTLVNRTSTSNGLLVNFLILMSLYTLLTHCYRPK